MESKRSLNLITGLLEKSVGRAYGEPRLAPCILHTFGVTLALPNIILMLTLCVNIASAEGDAPAIDRQYIVSYSASDNEILLNKAIDKIEDVINRQVAITDVSDVGAKIESPSDRIDPCKELEKEIREERKEGKVVRRYDRHCDENGILTASLNANDPYYSSMWGLQRLQMPSAWNYTTGANEVIVAVVDTGVNYNHPDLVENIWTNPLEIAGNGIDDDGNGVIDDIHGYNAITGSGDPMDDNGHGTHVSGTIGARTNNSTGVSGINWNTKIIASKFLSASGSGSLWDAVNALRYLKNLKLRGVNIVLSNNSWGGGGFYNVLRDEIAGMRDAGMLFVAAAGNSAQDLEVTPSYPASYDVDSIISVAAIEQQGALAYFSNYGSTHAHLGAPGYAIASTWVDGGYRYLNGTSMAAPHVSGAIALLSSYAFNLNYSQLKQKILGTVSYNSNLQGKVSTNGELNILAALQSSTFSPPVTPTPTRTPTPTATNTPANTPTPTFTPTMTPTPRAGSLTVTVRDETNIGVGQVYITLSKTGFSWSGYTGSDGVASIPNLSGGSYAITLSKNGYTFSNQSSTVYVDFTTYILVNAAKATYSYQGTVVNRLDASPLGGANVTFYTNGAITGTTTTGSDGKFSFTAPYGSAVTVEASKDDYNLHTSQSEVTGKVVRLLAMIPE